MGKNVRNVIVLVVIVGIIIGAFIYKANAEQKENETTVTVVQELNLKNLDKDYPPTPKEVVKFYGEVTKALYNDNYTDDEYKKLVSQIYTLFDEELKGINPFDSYLLSQKADIDKFREKGYSIWNISTSSSTDVETSIVNGFECAKLYCTITTKIGNNSYETDKEVFELRKDSDGHWKILGFKENVDN